MNNTTKKVVKAAQLAQITHADLAALTKAKLINIIRSTESYLLGLYVANDELSWRGTPENQQRAYTRAHAFKDAAIKLQETCK